MTTQHCPYEAEAAKELQEIKRWNKRVLVEPLIMLALILGYCMVQANAQQRDLQAQLDEQTKSRAATCHIKQHNTVHEFDCTLVKDKLAVIK
jgi:cell division protein ZapA (FtsZ GTPase activity inhibitor)